MFGTSGIRGVYGKEITEELATKIASIFAEGKRNLVVGRDIRSSGPALLGAICKGAASAGADIIDLGIVPTPTVALATKKYNCRGIMITASHNPPEYNGLKLIENGKEIGKDLEKEITKKYSEARINATAKNDAIIYHDHEAIMEHKLMVINMVDRKLIARKKPKVIVDCNGAGAVITPYLLSDLGCEVVSVNASLDCFNRASEPNRDNLVYLGKFVRNAGADFAIVHDGDADRCVVIDDCGEMVPFDVQLAIMIEHEIEKNNSKNKKNNERNNKKIIATVEASLTIRDIVERTGGELEITPVGSTFVADALEESGALFGGEPCGEYIYQDSVHVPDAILGAAKLVEIFCKNGQFSKLKTQYPQNFMVREKFPANDKYDAIERIKSTIKTMKIDGEKIDGKIRDDDGIRVDEKDGWFLIRASGTEPIIRLTMEYKTKEKLETKKSELVELITLCNKGTK